MPNFMILQSYLKPYLTLLKVRLSLVVSFSAGFGYALAAHPFIFDLHFFIFCLGSFCIAGGASAFNQIIEKKTDKIMERTKNRPLPTKTLTLPQAYLCAITMTVLGLYSLYISTNILVILLSLISFIIYILIYTPCKKITPIAVCIGAIPGALPPLIGCVAVHNEFSSLGFTLFLLQFIWQFPHFWSIAWLGKADYKKAGFKLLPMQGNHKMVALQMVGYTLLLIPCGLLPAQLGVTGYVSAILVSIFNLLFLWPIIVFVKHDQRNIALTIMFSSFLYLPLVQIIYLIDKL